MIPNADIERYADQLRSDAETADDDGIAVGLLRAADGLGDLIAAADAAEHRQQDDPQNDPWVALDKAMGPVLAQALDEMAERD